MIFESSAGLVRITLEPQFCLDTSSPLFTLQFPDFGILNYFGLDEVGDMRLDPSESLFPFSVHAYPEQFARHIPSFRSQTHNLAADVDFSPAPKAYRWIRWYDQLPDRPYGEQFGKYMVGHCFPEEVSKTRWLHCLLGDKFYVYPLASFPKDFDDIWIYEDEESEDEDA